MFILYCSNERVACEIRSCHPCNDDSSVTIVKNGCKNSFIKKKSEYTNLMYLRHNYLMISVTKVFSSFSYIFHLVKRRKKRKTTKKTPPEFMFLPGWRRIVELKCPLNVILVVLAYRSDLNENFGVQHFTTGFLIGNCFLYCLKQIKNVSLLVEILSIYCYNLVDKLMLL